MSDDGATVTKPGMSRFSAADAQVLAQVERWMALIREIKRERADN